MSEKFTKNTAASLAIAGLIVIGGTTAAITANADTPTPSSTPSASSSASGTTQGDHRGPGGSHTAVTGSEKTSVVDAVKAKDSAVTVTDVRKDADGSYDVHGTKAGKRAMVEVSKDLKTIEVRTFDETAGGRGGRGHGTEVTGAELTKVKAAVVAKNPGVTVEHVMKETDGSYHVMATKAGTRVAYQASKDLTTITVDTHGPRGDRRGTEVTGAELTKVKTAVVAKYPGTTVEHVMKDADGSYHVMATKNGTRTIYQATKDLTTITVDTHGPRGDKARQDAPSGTATKPA